MKFTIVFVVLVSACFAQNIKLDAGTSTMGVAGSGGSAELFFPNNTVNLSGGVVDGHAVGGASDSFMLRDGLATIGTQQLSQYVDGGGVSMQGVGVSYTRKDADNIDNVAGVFAGSVGTGFTLPWMATTVPQHIGFSAFMQRRIENFKIGFVSAVAGGEHTALGSLSWKSSNLSANAVAGMLNNQVFSSGTATYQRQNFNVTAAHFDTFTPIRARSDSVGGGFYTQRFSVGGGVSQSATALGGLLAENVTASFRYAKLQNTVGVYHSRNLMMVDTVTEHITRHIAAEELISHTEGNTSMSFGGDYTSNRLSCGVSQGIGYSPTLGYIRTTSVHIALSVHGTKLTAIAIEAPGIRQYQAGTEKWAQGPMQGKTRTVTHSSGGKFSVLGVVQDGDGLPLAGVAIAVGDTVLFTNRAGRFETHSKKAQPVLVGVDLDQTMTAGDWKVRDCPQTVMPTVEPQAITIVLVRP